MYTSDRLKFCLSLELLELRREVLVDHCRLVRFDEYTETLDQSFDEHPVCYFF